MGQGKASADPQLSIFDRPLPPKPAAPKPAPSPTRVLPPSKTTSVTDVTEFDQRFWAFHGANPHVYSELVRLARTLTARGYTRLGIGMLWETLRYTTMTTADPTSEFKLNDHYRSRYARLIMEREADLRGVFELRELRT